MVSVKAQVYPRESEKVKGYATIVLDDCFLVNDIKIISGKNGCFISMPAKKKRDGKFKDIAHPITKELRQQIEDAIFSEYEKVTGNKLNIRKTEEKDES
jgi:stage V sporulation protein G